MPEIQESHQRFTLDACALIAFFNDEEGSEIVEEIFAQALADDADLYVASVNLYEVYYDTWRRSSQETANQLLADMYLLPLTVIETFDKDLMQIAGYFKTTYRVSLADSVALALAKQIDAELISTDHHEFDVIAETGDARIYWLR